MLRNRCSVNLVTVSNGVTGYYNLLKRIWNNIIHLTSNMPFLFLFLCRWFTAEDILFSAVLNCVRDCILSLWKQYLTNWSWEFHQIYNIGAVGDKDELVRFWGQKRKGQGHDATKHGQKSLVQIWTFLAKTYQLIDHRWGPSS